MANNPIAIYESPEGNIKIDVTIGEEAVWPSLNQIAEVFCRDKSVKNIGNIKRISDNSI